MQCTGNVFIHFSLTISLPLTQQLSDNTSLPFAIFYGNLYFRYIIAGEALTGVLNEIQEFTVSREHHNYAFFKLAGKIKLHNLSLA